MNIGILEAVLRARDANFRSTLRRARGDLASLKTSVGNVARTVTRGLGLATAAVTGAGIAAIKMATDFNRSMANVATLIPGNLDRIRELKGEVQSLAIETGKSTADLSEGLYQTVSAFGDSAEAAQILEINAKAAAAGLSTTTEAIDLTSLVTKNYGDTSAAAVQKVSDLALQTVRLGQTTFPELASAMGRVVPVAQAMGQTQEELFAVFATATGVVGSASEVTTQYRGVLNALAAPSDAMVELYKKMGVESGEAALQQFGLVGTLQKIVDAANRAGVPLKDYITNIEAMPLALALAGPQADTFNQKLAEMGEAAGATEVAFREQTEGINAAGFQWDQLKQQLAVAAQNIGDMLIPVVLEARDIFLEWVGNGSIQGLVDAFGRNLPKAISILADATVILSRGFATLRFAAMQSANAIVIAFDLVVSSLTSVLVKLEETRRAFAIATGDMETVAIATMNITRLKELESAAWDTTTDNISAMTEAAREAIDKQRDMEERIAGIRDRLMEAADGFGVAGKATRAWGSDIGRAVEYVSPFPKVVSEAAKGADTAAQATAGWGSEMPSLGAGMAELYNELNRMEEQQRENVETTRAAAEANKNFFGTFQLGIPFIDNATAKLNEWVDSGLSKLSGKITGGLQGLFGDMGGKVGNMFGDLLGAGLGAAFGPLGSLVSAGISKLGGLALSGLKKLGGAILGGIKKLFGGPSAEELAGRDVAHTFRASLESVLVGLDSAIAGTTKWEREVVALRDSFLAMGRTEQEALAISEKLWRAEKQGPEAVKAVIAEIQPVLDEVQAAMNSTGLTLLELRNKAKESAKRLGISVQEAFKAIADGTIDTMKKATDATKEATKGVSDEVKKAEAGYKEALAAVGEAQKALSSATGVEAKAQADLMMQEAVRAADAWKKELDRLKGDSSDTADAVVKNLGGMTEKLKDRFENLELPLRFDPEGLQFLNRKQGNKQFGLPHFATGGVVPGPIGSPQVIVAHGGETVTPPGGKQDQMLEMLAKRVGSLEYTVRTKLPTIMSSSLKHAAQTTSQR